MNTETQKNRPWNKFHLVRDGDRQTLSDNCFSKGCTLFVSIHGLSTQSQAELYNSDDFSVVKNNNEVRQEFSKCLRFYVQVELNKDFKDKRDVQNFFRNLIEDLKEKQKVRGYDDIIKKGVCFILSNETSFSELTGEIKNQGVDCFVVKDKNFRNNSKIYVNEDKAKTLKDIAHDFVTKEEKCSEGGKAKLSSKDKKSYAFAAGKGVTNPLIAIRSAKKDQSLKSKMAEIADGRDISVLLNDTVMMDDIRSSIQKIEERAQKQKEDETRKLLQKKISEYENPKELKARLEREKKEFELQKEEFEREKEELKRQRDVLIDERQKLTRERLNPSSGNDSDGSEWSSGSRK
jgi:TusA-related sulfurtransferase